MRMRLLLFTIFVLMLLFLLPLAARAAASGEDALGGALKAELDGRALYFPVLKTEIEGEIQGDLATVSVVQTFANPTDRPLHATYLFPLNQDAAVFEMLMEVGAERVRAVIQEVRQAEQTFQKAKSEGRAAALLKQHRPNMFTQDIANLMPGLPITVRLRYVQTVPKVDGAYEWVVPLVVGPRFVPPKGEQPPGAGVAPKTESTVAGTWELETLPDYPPVSGLHIPQQVDMDRVALKLRLNGGMPIQDARSDTHPLSTHTVSTTQWEIGLAQGKVVDNRDFVLRYRLAGTRTQAGLLAQQTGGGGYFSLLLEPPAAPQDNDIVPREMVFLLDCSGSMSGLPMDASKAFMRQALRKLRPTDSFRIIRFSDSASEFSEQPLAATSDNVARGLRYTQALEGEGGTMMTSGIRQALQVPPPDGVNRIVVFLTDGYIGNEHEILTMIQALRGDARLYTFGVGAGVNRYLLEEIGRVGYGFTRYMDPTEDVGEVAAQLTDRLQSPVLTDIEIDWGELPVEEVYPRRIPDLFAGQSVRIQGRYAKPGRYTVTVRGRTRGSAAALRLPVDLQSSENDGAAVSLIWARSAIAEAMHDMSVPPHIAPAVFRTPPSYEQLKQRVTDLGLKFSLVTRWTSFVAVSEQVYNNAPQDTETRAVPLPQVKGVSHLAYPQAAAFTGAAGPEPGEYAALLTCLLLAGVFLRLRRGRGVRG